MKPIKAIFVLPLFLLIALAAGAPDEAMGRVTVCRAETSTKCLLMPATPR